MTTITALPTPPSRSDPTNFAVRADEFLGALPDFATETNLVAGEVNTNAANALTYKNQAEAAASAALATTNTVLWVSGTTYAIGDVTYSPITFLSYRRKTNGAGTTDPSADSTNWQLVAGSGDVTLNGTETLINKTIEAGTFTNGYTEEVFALGTTGSIALSPSNGSIQTCSLTGNPTFTDSLAAGQSIVLMLTNGASYTVTWPTVTWVKAGGSAAPTLTANDVLVFWKVSTTLYGAYVGSGV